MPDDNSIYGLYLPTTQVYEVESILGGNPTPQDFKNLLVRLYQNLNNMALAINAKDTGRYLPEEFVNGQLWFFNTGQENYRQNYRMVVSTGTLAPGATTVAHNIAFPATATQLTFTRIVGMANDTAGGNYYPLVGGNAAPAGMISVYADQTNLYFDNNTGVVFDVGYVILEYLKN